jgi:GntR family transcriptional regulator
VNDTLTSGFGPTGEPAYRRIARELTDQIQQGQLPPGAKLPSTAQLVAHYGVSTTVVRAAVKQLQLTGLVIGQQGKGVFVRYPSERPPPALDPVAVSRLLFEARELVEMFADVIKGGTGKDDVWCRRIVTEIDLFRARQGWSPDGYGYGPDDRPDPGRQLQGGYSQ